MGTSSHKSLILINLEEITSDAYWFRWIVRDAAENQAADEWWSEWIMNRNTHAYTHIEPCNATSE